MVGIYNSCSTRLVQNLCFLDSFINHLLGDRGICAKRVKKGKKRPTETLVGAPMFFCICLRNLLCAITAFGILLRFALKKSALSLGFYSVWVHQPLGFYLPLSFWSLTCFYCVFLVAYFSSHYVFLSLTCFQCVFLVAYFSSHYVFLVAYLLLCSGRLLFFTLHVR